MLRWQEILILIISHCHPSTSTTLPSKTCFQISPPHSRLRCQQVCHLTTVIRSIPFKTTVIFEDHTAHCYHQVHLTLTDGRVRKGLPHNAQGALTDQDMPSWGGAGSQPRILCLPCSALSSLRETFNNVPVSKAFPKALQPSNPPVIQTPSKGVGWCSPARSVHRAGSAQTGWVLRVESRPPGPVTHRHLCPPKAQDPQHTERLA